MSLFEPEDFHEAHAPADEESAASLLLTEFEPPPFGDPYEETLPGTVEARYGELASAREARLSVETDRLQRDLALAADKARAEREYESRSIREVAAREQAELKTALEKERESRVVREGELTRAVQALSEENKRLKALNAVLEQQASGVRAQLTAVAARSAEQGQGLAEHNVVQDRRLVELTERLSELERFHKEKVEALEAEVQRRVGELEMQERMVAQAHETAVAETRRAEDAERALRESEHAAAEREAEGLRRLEARLREEAAQRLKTELDSMRAELSSAADSRERGRLERQKEELTAAHRKAAAEALEHALAEQAAAFAKEREALTASRDKELAEAAARGEREGEIAALKEAGLAAQQAQREAETAKEREKLDLRESLLKEHAALLERAARAQGEAELRMQEDAMRRLQSAQEEWRLRAEADAGALRARLNAEREKALAELRAERDVQLASERGRTEQALEKAEAEAYKKARREAEAEMAAKVDRMGGEWQRIKGRFEEELGRLREELKRREREWQDHIQSAGREAARVKEEARISVLKMERELLSTAEEKSKLAAEKLALEESLRRAGEEAAAMAARREVEKASGEQQAKRDKEAQDRALAELRLNLEGKLKALDAQLREERKKTVELLAKAKAEAEKPIWKRITG